MTVDKISALRIACQAEQDAIDRAVRADNAVAASLNRQRLIQAQTRLRTAIAQLNAQRHQGAR